MNVYETIKSYKISLLPLFKLAKKNVNQPKVILGNARPYIASASTNALKQLKIAHYPFAGHPINDKNVHPPNCLSIMLLKMYLVFGAIEYIKEITKISKI